MGTLPSKVMMRNKSRWITVDRGRAVLEDTGGIYPDSETDRGDYMETGQVYTTNIAASSDDLHLSEDHLDAKDSTILGEEKILVRLAPLSILDRKKRRKAMR